MKVWMDIWDPTYTEKLGDGPILLKSASINRALDETGDGSAEMPGIEPRVITLLEARRVCEIWVQEEGFDKRLVGTFVIEKDGDDEGQSVSTSISGRSAMVALANKITFPGLVYDEAAVAAVVASLTDLAGWTADVDATVAAELISVPFNGDSVLRALQVIAETMGVHLRMGDDSQEIEFGPFGEVAESYIDAIEGDGGEIHTLNDSLLLITRISIIKEAAGIINYGLCFPGGSGDSNDYMGYSTRDFVDQVSLYGRTHYIIKNAASIAEYGQIERRLDAKRITPVDNTDAALVAAANAAADAIKAKIDRIAFPQEVLNLDLRNVRQTIKPGDKIHIRYQGDVDKHGIPYKYRDIDDDYWVMRVSERIEADGITLSLEVSNIDRYRTDAAGIVVGMVDAIQVEKVDVQPYPLSLPWGPFQKPIDTNTDVDFNFPVFDNVLRLNSAKAFIIRDYWTAVAGTALANGAHRHRVAQLVGAVPFNGAALLNATYTFRNSGAVAFNSIIATSTAQDYWTEGASDPHTHDTEFSEVQRDSQLPEQLYVEVNGVPVELDAFPDGNTDWMWEIDITDPVLGLVGGFRGLHNMTIACGEGRGDLHIIILLDLDIRKVRAA